MDESTLRIEIDRLFAEARERRKEADRLKISATGLRGTGDESTADIEERQAADLEQQAGDLERQAESAQSELASTVRQINDLERRQADLTRNYEREMADLQGQKDRLQGGLSSFSSSLF